MLRDARGRHAFTIDELSQTTLDIDDYLRPTAEGMLSRIEKEVAERLGAANVSDLLEKHGSLSYPAPPVEYHFSQDGTLLDDHGQPYNHEEALKEACLRRGVPYEADTPLTIDLS